MPGGGAVFDLPQVTIENGELTFQYPQGKPQTNPAGMESHHEGRAPQGTAHPGTQWSEIIFVERRARAGLAGDSAEEKARQAYRPVQW